MCVHCAGYPNVPDPGGLRFCTHCENFIPVASFPSGPRRYVCKAHMRAGCKRSTQKMLRNPQKGALSKIWAMAYKDRKQFQQTRVGIKQDDIDNLLIAGVADEMRENTALYTELAKRVAVVPVNPSKILCVSNAILVTTGTRKLILKQLKLLGTNAYCKSLRKEQSYLTMNPIDDHRDSQSSPDDYFDDGQELEI
jgi:hypothetical protein